jgi:8-oxo-dGTP diphosphatase
LAVQFSALPLRNNYTLIEMGTTKKYSYKYPHPAVTTDSVIFGFDGSNLNVLLIERGIEPYKGRWAFPGGFIRMEETAEEGARRELREETGVENVFMEQLQAFSGINRDPRERVITIAFYALIKQSDYQVIGGDDASKAHWFRLHEIPELAFDHDSILRVAMSHLKQKIHFEPIGFELLSDKFTMTQLQSLYESILEIRFDRRNFYKKMLSMDYIVPLDEKMSNTTHRAARYFSFNREKYQELKEKGFRLEF